MSKTSQEAVTQPDGTLTLRGRVEEETPIAKTEKEMSEGKRQKTRRDR